MKTEEHLAKIEREIHAMDRDGHLEQFKLSVCVNAIEHQLFEARRLVENGRRNNRGGDSISPD